MEKIVLMVGVMVLVLVVFTGLAFLLALPCMWLWNYLMPELFGLQEIGYLQAVAMLLLSRLLFGSYTNTSSKK